MSKLDHSSEVWNSGLTQKNRKSIERIQKAAVRIILKNKFKNYQDGLKYLNMDDLEKMRNEKVRDFFPLNQDNVKNTRNHDKYKVKQEWSSMESSSNEI